ncbi:MAG: DUF4331 domain-containing protein, partial [Sphingobacteriales bacterium]
VSSAKNILDPDFVIGVWASASRQMVRTLVDNGMDTASGSWVQVSRLGMPLTNEAVIPIGAKDRWNSRTPYTEDTATNKYFYNPELALYMDDSQFGSAVPAFGKLRIQRNSLQAYDFGNGHDGLYGLKGNAALNGTALDDKLYGTLLLPGKGKPRSVDLWPLFHTGVPNLAPYQLATGKSGNPLAAGKPFINNFLPNGGDMLRLNMAVPVTPRNSTDFSSLGLVQAAVLGLTDARFNTTKTIQNIPNMDGFPNGRRLEDDVTRIELQAVSGVVLAAIGLWYDDYNPATSTSPVTQDLLNVITYTTGVEENDTTFKSEFPYAQTPWRGTSDVSGPTTNYKQPAILKPTSVRCDAGKIATSTGDTSLNICISGNDGFVKFTNTTQTSAKYRYILTDASGVISTISFADSLSLKALGKGSYRVYGLSYADSVLSQPGTNINDIKSNSCFQLSSNFIPIVRDSVNAGTIAFATGNATADTVCTGANVKTMFKANNGATSASRAYIVTDANDNIVSISMADSMSFGTKTGVNRIYTVSYIGNLNAKIGNKISTVTSSGCANVSSNFVTIVSDSVRTNNVSTTANATTDTVCVGTASTTGFKNTAGTNNGSFAYIITDANGKIISVSNTASADFSTGAAGNRRVYGVSYLGRLNAKAGDDIATVTSSKCAKISGNFITIIRATTDAGSITTMNNLKSDTFCMNKNMTGYLRFKTSSAATANFVYVLTDANNKIISVSSTDSVNFSGQAKGTMLRVYGVSYVGQLNAIAGADVSTVSSGKCTDVSADYVNIAVEECQTVSIRNTDFAAGNISIFPNPAENNLNIVTDVRFSKVTIVNALGQIVYEQNNTVAGTNTIEVSKLKAGMYFISFYANDAKTTRLFLKD